MSNFSFFESYFFSLINEIIDFHGGDEEYLNFIERKITQNNILSSTDENNLKKLRVEHKGKDAHKYDKFTRLIGKNQIIWPSQKLALYGAKQIINNRKRWNNCF